VITESMMVVVDGQEARQSRDSEARARNLFVNKDVQHVQLLSYHIPLPRQWKTYPVDTSSKKTKSFRIDVCTCTKGTCEHKVTG
jgi:hypothetical protein